MDVLNYIFNAPTYAARDLREIGPALRTAGSELIKPVVSVADTIYRAPEDKKIEAVKKAFADTINNDRVKRMAKGAVIGAGVGTVFTPIGTLGGAITGGLAGLVGPKNFANSVLSTYNTSVEDITSGKFNPREAVRGALEHPVYSAMDIAGIGGIGKSVGKAFKTGIKSGGAIQQMLPGKEHSMFNRQLANAQLSAQSKTANLYTGYNALSRMPGAKRSEFVKQITRDKSSLKGKNKVLAEEIKKNLQEGEQLRIELGELDPQYSKNNTVAQYVMAEMEGKNKLLHKDIMDIIEAKPLQPRAEAILAGDKTLGDKVLNLILKGEDLYDKKKIAFLSQELTPTTDPSRMFNASKYNLENPIKYGYSRLIGRATPEMQGAVLDDIIKLQLNDTSRASNAIDILKDALDSDLIKNIHPDTKKEIIADFRTSIAKDIRNGKAPDLKEALNNSSLKRYIDKNFYKSLEGIMTIPSGNAWTRITNAWKRFVLGNPGWIAGNRLGNWSNNAVEGVTLRDYFDVKKYEKFAPDQLKQQTAYNSMINSGNEALVNEREVSGFAEPLTDLRRGFGRFSQSEKNLSDYIRLGTDTMSGLSDLVTNPFFKREARWEFADRYANYIRQAKRYASKNNMKLENVLKQSQKDKKLFGKLNTEVNKSLGDYYGKNYALPQAFRTIVSEGMPFYRFPVQTGRVTFHQMANHPSAFATNITMPARVGNDIYKEYLDKYHLNPKYFEGGTPYYVEDGRIKIFSLTPPPLGILAERLTDPSKFVNSLSPFATNVKDAVTYKKFGRQPSSPTLEVAKLIQGQSPELIKFIKEYEGSKEEKQWLANYLKRTEQTGYLNDIGNPNVSDRFKFLVNELLGNFNPYYMLSTRYVPGALSLLKGDVLQTRYDTDPFTDYPEGNVKTSPVELIGNWLGISNRAIRPEKPVTKRQMDKARRQAGYTRQNIMRQNMIKQRGKK